MLDLLSDLRYHDDEDLSVQLDVFEEQRLEDEEELLTPEGVNLTSHLDVFHELFKRVRIALFDFMVASQLFISIYKLPHSRSISL
mgnify:CR=1 FL=1